MPTLGRPWILQKLYDLHLHSPELRTELVATQAESLGMKFPCWTTLAEPWLAACVHDFHGQASNSTDGAWAT